jgi:hypothetical protein
MSYKDFTLRKIQARFGLDLIKRTGIFADVEERAVSQSLRDILLENVPLATAINTEKARSELIISPVLVELRKVFDRRISLFSGIEFNVDKDQELNGQDLNGCCDFIIGLSDEQLFLKSPILAVVEAKNENLMGGMGQCVAEMIASRLFNAEDGWEDTGVYGVVTSGTLWKFLKLQGNQVHIDLDDYVIKEIPKILGILSGMVEQSV